MFASHLWRWLLLVGLVLTPAGWAQELPRKPQPARVRVDLAGDPLPVGPIARLGTLRLRHDGEVNSVAFSPDGKLVASAATWDAKVWDVATGRELERFRGKLRAQIVAFSPDGKTLLAVNHDGAVTGWDVETGTIRTRTASPLRDAYFSTPVAAFSADRKLLALTDHGDKLVLLDVATGKPLLRLEKSGALLSVAVSPDGRTLATGGQDNVVRLWDVVTGKERHQLKGHTNWVDSVTFSPDGISLASAGGDDLRLWDVATGREVRVVAEGSACIAFSPDGRTLATGTGNTIRLWDVASGKLIRHLTGHGSWLIPALAFSPDGKRLVSGSRDHTVIIWDVATGQPLHHFPGHRGAVISLAFAPDGKTLASGGDEDHTLIVWDLATAKPRHVFPDHHGWVTSIAWSPDGKVVVSGEGSNGKADQERRIHVWDPAKGRLLREWFGHLGGVHTMTFSPDGKTLLSSGWDARVRIWDVGSGKRLQQLRVSDGVKRFAFSPDGKSFLVADGSGGRIALHRTEDGAKVRDLGNSAEPFPRGYLVAILAGGKKVLTINPLPRRGEGLAAEARIWDVVEGRVLRSFPVPFRSAGTEAFALSPDGKVLAFSDGDATIHLWDVETGKRLIGLRGHSGYAVSLAFTPDGKTLASGSWDTTVLLWDVPRARRLGLWNQLAANERAEQAARALATTPEATSFLAEQLRRAAAREAPYARLIANLDSDSFETREEASRQLGTDARNAEFALCLVLTASPPIEVRRRVESVLETLAASREKEVRQLLREDVGIDSLHPAAVSRAVGVLEHIGTAEARRVLAELAKGPEGATLARQARAALDRLAKRGPKR